MSPGFMPLMVNRPSASERVIKNCVQTVHELIKVCMQACMRVNNVQCKPHTLAYLDILLEGPHQCRHSVRRGEIQHLSESHVN